MMMAMNLPTTKTTKNGSSAYWTVAKGVPNSMVDSTIRAQKQMRVIEIILLLEKQ